MEHIIKSPTKINNTIIISPPQCGKTTLLRDIVRNLSNGNDKFNFKGAVWHPYYSKDNIADVSDGSVTVSYYENKNSL